jgi:5-methylcytosine-specific restriction protein A
MPSRIRSGLLRVFEQYPIAVGQPFRDHPLNHFWTHQFSRALYEAIDSDQLYHVEASMGKGRWAGCPWAVILDILVTETPQEGYYIVYLFREDMKGVYLSLNQGVTSIREEYKEDPKKVLKRRAADFRGKIGPLPANFSETEIDLAGDKHGLSSYYEAGNICAHYYAKEALPSESELILDLKTLLEIYGDLSYRDTKENIETHVRDGGADEFRGIEDRSKVRLHKRIEGSAKLKKEAKRIHGYMCHACAFDFEKRYGLIGHQYIEAHHLVPVSTLKGQKVELDARRDFAVLCSNCHRMIHRLEKPEDIGALKTLLASQGRTKENS